MQSSPTDNALIRESLKEIANVLQLTWSFRVSFPRRRSSCRSLSDWPARAGPGCGATTAPCAPSEPSRSASVPRSPCTSEPEVKWYGDDGSKNNLRLNYTTNKYRFGVHFIYSERPICQIMRPFGRVRGGCRVERGGKEIPGTTNLALEVIW